MRIRRNLAKLLTIFTYAHIFVDVTVRSTTSEGASVAGETVDLVSILKALADPSRLRIIGLLSKGELCVGEIVYVLGVSQTNISRHLDKLRRAGLVVFRKSAQWAYYGLSQGYVAAYPGVFQLVTKEIGTTPECATDAKALAAYRKSGMTCSDLRSCRRKG